MALGDHPGEIKSILAMSAVAVPAPARLDRRLWTVLGRGWVGLRTFSETFIYWCRFDAGRGFALFVGLEPWAGPLH
jgi:hypothetical protein